MGGGKLAAGRFSATKRSVVKKSRVGIKLSPIPRLDQQINTRLIIGALFVWLFFVVIFTVSNFSFLTSKSILLKTNQKGEILNLEIITTHDWTKFRNLETLPQKAGVSRDKLSLLFAKELADNALDHCGHCEVGYLEPNGFYVKDNGDGIDPVLLPDLFD